MWTCTCPDFTGRCQRFGLVCKHIGAVQIYTSETNPVHMEDLMTKNTQSTPAITEQGQPAPEDLIGRLRQPLDMSRVKRRQAPGQGTVPYLEGFDVLEMANDLFQFRWSFDLLGEPQVMRWERQVTIYDQQARKKVPLLGEDGRPVYEPVGICYITGRVQVELGDRLYSHADVGRCVFSGDSPEALDMAIAGAATDCLKRCFRQMGEQFGNGLYDKEVARTAGIESEGVERTRIQRQRPIRKTGGAQATCTIKRSSAQTAVPQYRDGVAVEASNTAEMEAFAAFQSAHQGLAPASREVLRAWAASRNGK